MNMCLYKDVLIYLILYMYTFLFPGHDILAFKNAEKITPKRIFQAGGLYFQNFVLKALNTSSQNPETTFNSGSKNVCIFTCTLMILMMNTYA